jgi:triacylglycerol lipase
MRAAAFCLLVACGGSTVGPLPPNPTTPDAAVVTPPTAKGPYPIILVHGLFGFNNIGPLDYFYGIHDQWTAAGRQVFAPKLDSIQASAVRGVELMTEIESVRNQTGADKVVLVGHSQGGLDARWAASHDPDHVAAVVTIATPHRGSPVADVAGGILPGDSSAALNALADLFGASDAGSSSSFPAAIHLLTTPGAAEFNANTPDAPGVAYYSIAGRSNLASACDGGTGDPMTTRWNDQNDPIGLELAAISGILYAAALPDTPVHDGLVTVDSAKWGTFLGCLPADHIDEVGQIAGQSPGLGNSFDYKAFYADLESFLTANGF